MDDVSLTKSYDILINSFALHGSSGEDYMYRKGSGLEASYFTYITSSDKYSSSMGDGTVRTVATNNATINTTSYYLQSFYIDRTSNQVLYVNGVASTGTSLTNLGKVTYLGSLYIGTYAGVS